MSAKKIDANIGDIFIIPLEESQFAFGQVIESNNGILYVVVYEGLATANSFPSINKIIEKNIIIASLTQDAKIWNGDWEVIGNELSNINEIKKPCFLVHYFEDDSYYIESFDKSAQRPAVESEKELIPKRFAASPKRIENAVIAINGMAEWNKSYEKLTYDSIIQRSDLI